MSDAVITTEINAEIFARFSAMFAGGTPTVDIGVLWLDPVSLGVQAPQGSADYSLATNTATNNISQSYVSVGGNVEVVVLAGLAGTFKLDVNNVPQQARGGAVVLDSLGNQVVGFTDALRTGTTEFLVTIGTVSIPGGPGTGGPGTGGPGTGGPGTGGPGTGGPGTGGPGTGGPGTGGLGSNGGTGNGNGGGNVAGNPGTTIAGVTQTASAILISALLTGFPDTSSGQTNSLGGANNGANGGSTGGSTQNSSSGSTNSGAGSSGGSEGAPTDGRSSFLDSVFDRAFLNLPDSVGGFIDLADQLMQDGQDAAQTLSERINAFLKSQKPPAPMNALPQSLQPPPETSGGVGGMETRKPGDKETGESELVVNASPTDYAGWRANEYGLTLFLASGLGYIGLRDLAGDTSDPRKKRHDIPLSSGSSHHGHAGRFYQP